MTRLIGLALLALAGAAATSGGGNDASSTDSGIHGLSEHRRISVRDMPRLQLGRSVRQDSEDASQAGGSAHVLRIYSLAADGIATPEPAASPTNTPVNRDPYVTATPEPTRDAPVYGGFPGEITHYGDSFNGLPMACGGTYWGTDVSIAAVPYPSRNQEWPCGQAFVVTGPAGSLRVVRTDSCPGCHHNQLDLSESGMMLVCGYLGRCPVRIEVK